MNRSSFAAIAVIAAAILVAGCERGTATCGSLLVADAWVREAPPGAPAAAGYLTILNSGGGTVSVTGATSPDYDRVELHRSERDGDQMRMRPLERLDVRAGDKTVLAPGGAHLMLMQPRTVFTQGDDVTLRLQCPDGQTRAFTAPVRRDAPAGG